MTDTARDTGTEDASSHKRLPSSVRRPVRDRLGGRVSRKRTVDDRDGHEHDTRDESGAHAAEDTTIDDATVDEARAGRREERPRHRSSAKVVKRNRRMFGVLNATLKRASVRTETQDKAEAKQREVAQRLDQERKEAEEKRIAEKAARLKADAEAFVNDHKTIVEEHQPKWDAHNRILSENFIFTVASPRIFYVPAKHTHHTRKLLDASRDTVLSLATERQQRAVAAADAEQQRRFDPRRLSVGSMHSPTKDGASQQPHDP
eukprot:m.81668 g.81668  ORF g.81668 m.81668 type:complete len:261 (-) comp9419_c0_seq2:278-1060(-)